MKRLKVYPTPPRLAVEDTQGAVPNPGCTMCGLHKAGDGNCASGELFGAADGGPLYVIGRSPQLIDLRRSRPLQGAAGQWLRRVLLENWHGPIAYDYALRCHCPKKAAASQVNACRAYTAHNVGNLSPSRIICLGSEAIQSVTGAAYPPHSVRRGYTYTSDGVPVFLFPSPEQAIRNHFLRQWFEDDLAWATTFNPPKPARDGVVWVISTPREAQEAAEDLRLAPWVSWDIEAFGAPFSPEGTMLSVAFTPADMNYAYLLDIDGLQDLNTRAPLFNVLADPNVPKGGHGVKYDVTYMASKYGIRVQTEWDTMLLRRYFHSDVLLRLEYAQALVGMAGDKDEVKTHLTKGAQKVNKYLKNPTCSAPGIFYFGAQSGPEWDAKELAAVDAISKGVNHKRYTFACVPPDTLYRYNGRDTISTDRFYRHLLTEAETDPGPMRVWEEIGRDMNEACTEMEINGIAVSIPRLRDLQTQMGDQIAELESELFTTYGEFNYNAPAQVAALLFDKLKLPVESYTDTGLPQTTAAVLGRLNHPAADALLKLRKAVKFKSQYADGMMKFVGYDGRIHPSIKVVGTGTGRPSCEEPNLLNIPRADSDAGKLCRSVFVAPPGRVLIEIDQSQIELRVAAMLSGDELMAEFFLRGEDFHLATAKAIAPLFGIDPATVTKAHPLRSQAKIINFATLYGDPPAGLAFKLGCSVKQAERLQAAILGKFKKLAAWIKEQLAFGKRHGYCMTYWNGLPLRRRSLWEIGEPKENKAQATAERSSWNTPIQGSAADFTNASLGGIHKWLKQSGADGKLILTVYDSVLLETAEDQADHIASNCQTIMQSWPSQGVPLVADVKMGPSWGEMVGD